MSKQTQTLWQHLTSPELGEAAQRGTIVIVPVGAIEQHGPHLPVDTDIFAAYEVACATAAQIDEVDVIVAPPVWWGISPHHLGFAGTISLQVETFVDLLCDICRSIAFHGFRHIVILNGHGGNAEAIGVCAIKLSQEGIFVAALTYFALISEELKMIGESPLGGMSHACEMETSLLLALRPDLVHMDRAVAEMRSGPNSFVTWDMRDPRPVFFAYDMKRDSRQGVIGDPTAATAAKGNRIFDAAVQKLTRFLHEFRAQPL